MLSGLPGKARDLIVDVHNSHLECCGGFKIPAVSYSHKEVEAARGKFQGRETSFADPTTKRSGKDHSGRREASSLLSRCLLRMQLPKVKRGLLPFLISQSGGFFSWLLSPWTNVHSSQPSLCLYNVPAMGLLHSQGNEAPILFIHLFEMLAMEAKASCTLGKHPTIDLYSSLNNYSTSLD